MPSSEPPSFLPDGRAGPAVATVHLFIWRLDVDAAVVAECRRVLSSDEVRRADRFVRERDSARFVVARATLREILAGHVGCAPADLRLLAGEHGKPHLDVAGVAGPLHFNLSHSEDVAVLGVCQDCAVGVDLEAMRPVDEALADEVFAQAERAELTALATAAQLQGFYNGWTRKEAVIKADGRGLSLPLDSFGVSLDPAAPARLVWSRDDRLSAAPLSLAAFDPGPGFAGAVAARAPGCRLVMTRWAA